MSAFTYEIATVQAAVDRLHPGHAKGIYALPWYLVLGEPGSGRSAAIHAMNLTWPQGDGPLRTGLPTQLCTFWLPQEAVFIEPESNVLGPRRNPELLKELCDELLKKRPREPLDGVVLVLSVAEFIDLDEKSLETHANAIRQYLVEVGRRLHADVPVYVVLTRYDTVWGFGDVFQWTPDRMREDPWGFTLPADTPSQESLPRIQKELDGLNARFEAFCLAKLAGEDHPENRTRAFQHLAEVRALMAKLREVFRVIAMANAFERAPWIRAIAIGSAMPGSGDKLRAGVSRFFNMGYAQGPPPSSSGRPGGLPIHAFMKTVVLPERDLVPLRERWRDDKLIVIGFIVGVLATIATGVLTVLAYR
jgi:type VI protein secretion system component VasK